MKKSVIPSSYCFSGILLSKKYAQAISIYKTLIYSKAFNDNCIGSRIFIAVFHYCLSSLFGSVSKIV